MERESENKEQQLADFKLQVKELYRLLFAIAKLNHDLFSTLNQELIVDPISNWRAEYGELAGKSQFVHALMNSTVTWDISPNLDLPNDLVFKHLTEVIMPRLKKELEKLQSK